MLLSIFIVNRPILFKIICTLNIRVCCIKYNVQRLVGILFFSIRIAFDSVYNDII